MRLSWLDNITMYNSVPKSLWVQFNTDDFDGGVFQELIIEPFFKQKKNKSINLYLRWHRIGSLSFSQR